MKIRYSGITHNIHLAWGVTQRERESGGRLRGLCSALFNHFGALVVVLILVIVVLVMVSPSSSSSLRHRR